MGNGFIHKLKPHSSHTKQLEKIRSIEFSGTTYQIEVEDQDGTINWPFFQFDQEGVLSDAFCSCGIEDEPCSHLQAAYSQIYNGHTEPLHIRFKKSFWNRLCFNLAEQLGTKPSRHIEHQEILFDIHARTDQGKKWIDALIDKRPKATPENSLKFSGLTQEEISHWKIGRASPALRYELSFWSDLAKQMMLLQDSKIPYNVNFEEIDHLPLGVSIEWQDFTLQIEIDSSLLIKIIPSLNTIHSPLHVHLELANSIESITYDESQKVLLIHYKNPKGDFAKIGKVVGEWTYIPEDGFYPLGKKLLQGKNRVETKEIPQFLSTYKQQLAPFIPLHPQSQPLSYDLRFDSEWNLQISAYLLEKGDLEKEGSAFFGKWVYVKGKGFFAVKGAIFDTPSKLIERDQVSSFVHYHRSFLNAKEGFSIHLASVESAITYTVSEKGLRFLNKFHEENLEIKDFGDWIYYRGQGFFPKRTSGGRDVLFAGLEVPPSGIHFFIKLNRDALELLPHFFTQREIVLRRGLRLEVKDETKLLIVPECVLIPEFQGAKFTIYGDFIYVEEVGFYEFPPHMRLPPRFQESITIPEKGLSHFFEEEYKGLHSFFTYIDPRVQTPHLLELELLKLEKEDQGGLKIEGKYVSEIGEVSLDLIFEAFDRNKNFLFSPAGLLDLSESRFSWIGGVKEDKTLSTLDFLKLDITEGVQVKDQASLSLLTNLRTMTTHEEPNLKGLRSELRLYQKTGLEWLWFLYRNGLSGLLCDEMGLGKTHQAMALIAAIRNHKKGRFLVVAPTSVIYHWQEKLNLFLPDLKVHFFHGLKRTLKGFPRHGILLTSYGILRSEKKSLSKIHFEAAIFDEIQLAKNPLSRIHEALLNVKANIRLGLTGTPIENYLRELKALFDIVLPGYMPHEKEFKDNFVLPIEREGNSEKKALLSKLIKPFILRRKKQEVLQELPEKTIDKVYCDLSTEQQRLYQATLERERSVVLEQLQSGDGPIPYVHIFSILSKLKQICNHPALLLKEPENYQAHESGKWEVFVELLSEALEGEQKVVIFSQYLQMLDIFECYLREKGVNYAQIRGSTLNRKEEMDRFREDPNCLVFLGSLQAAGLGIDLTSASIVILYDRWWNAARENQAIDRVHRIGQKWGVQVYKLITKGSVEEKIDQIIARKGQLMEEIVTADDEATLKRFTREELIDLLAFTIKT